MSNKDTTETYLNLNSDQFNSWLKDFETKYEKAEENSNLNKNKLDEYNNCDSDTVYDNSDESIDSDDNSEEVSSNVFMQENKSNITNNNSSQSSKLIYNRTRIRRRNNSDKNITLSESSSSDTKFNKNKVMEVVNEKPNYIPLPVSKEEIYSLKQLNSMLPSENRNRKKNKVIEKTEVDTDINVVQRKLGDQALYKFIMNRRR